MPRKILTFIIMLGSSPVNGSSSINILDLCSNDDKNNIFSLFPFEYEDTNHLAELCHSALLMYLRSHRVYFGYYD